MFIRWGGPYGPPPADLHRADGGQDFFAERDNQAAEHAQDSLSALAGVVGLDAHAQLDDAPAQDNYADGLDAGKNEIAQVVDNGERVISGGKGRYGECGAEGQRQNSGEIEAAGAAVPSKLLPGERGAWSGVVQLFHRDHTFHSIISRLSSPSKGMDKSSWTKDRPGWWT